MDTVKSIANIRDCFGCGVCAVVCPKQIIEIHLNERGFYEPQIVKLDLCVGCALCRKVCSFSDEGCAVDSSVVASYAAWSKNAGVRRQCSSGGVAFEIGRYLLGEGYKVLGVRYNTGFHRAEHYIASSVTELEQSIGSKYIQSYTVDAFRSINRSEKYLVVGTPCQIDSFRRYIRHYKIEENFILVDFFCHGVPSMNVWKKYLQKVEKKLGTIFSVYWRDKKEGWHKSYRLKMEGEKGEYVSQLSCGDSFYGLFFSDECLGEACYQCKFKKKISSADIRVGDMWGKTMKANEEGVSSVLVFSDGGESVLKASNSILVAMDGDIVAEGQMEKSPTKGPLSVKLSRLLSNPLTSIDRCYRPIRNARRRKQLAYRLQHPIAFCGGVVKRIFKLKINQKR